MEYPEVKKPKTIVEIVLKMMRMRKLVDNVMESQRFFEDYARQREKDAEEYREREPPPVFNKRLFMSSGSLVITNEARRIMARNGRVRPKADPEPLTKSELMSMRSVVDGLKLIHKGHEHVKDALSHVMTFETYGPHNYIVKRPYEDVLSCYYVIQGSVEVTYDMTMSETRSVYQPNIIYNHGAGEFLGLVSAEGINEDLSPPATVYTKDMCEFLRIDRVKFHKLVKRYSEVFDRQKREFMSRDRCVLSLVTEETKEKILDKIYRQEYPPNRQILLQGDFSDYLYFVYLGRCHLFREVFIPEAERVSNFFLKACEPGSFFGEECILDKQGSCCSVSTASHVVIFKLHKSAFEVVSKDSLFHLIRVNRREYPDDDELRERGYTVHTWNKYKHNAIKDCLKERGQMQYLRVKDPKNVHRRPVSAIVRGKENMYRFMLKGGQEYEPLRTRGRHSISSPSLSDRPHTTGFEETLTVPSINVETEESPNKTEIHDNGNGNSHYESTEDLHLSGSITQMPSDMARILAKHVGKHVTKEKLQYLLKEGDGNELLKLLDESTEVGRQLRMALEGPSGQDGFTKTTVLMTMKTDDIVRKAKEAAQSNPDHSPGDVRDLSPEWKATLYEENQHAKTLIAADKFRVAYLRNKMRALEKRRQKNKARNDQRVKESEAKKPEEFFLDKIQNNYQGLDPDTAMKKTSSLGFTAIFLAKALAKRPRRHASDTALARASSVRRQETSDLLSEMSSERPATAPDPLLTTRSSVFRTQSHQHPAKTKTTSSTLSVAKKPNKGKPSFFLKDQLKQPLTVGKGISSSQIDVTRYLRRSRSAAAKVKSS